jgi:hypothetical protein
MSIPGLLFTVLGIVCLVLSFKRLRFRQELAGNGKLAQGVVCAIAERPHPCPDRLVMEYAPVIQFTNEQGAEIKYTAGDWTNPSEFSEGDRVEVVYDPLDPQLAMISEPRINRRAMLITVGVGATFLLSGILLLIGVLPIQ